MIDLNELKRLAGKVTPGDWSHVRNPENTRWIIDSKPDHAIACTAGFEPDNEANAELICLLRNNLPTIIAALETARLVRDEDWLAGVMAAEFPTSSKMFQTWTKIKCKLSAREIIAALPKEEV